MNKYQVLVIAAVSCCLTLGSLAGLLLIFNWAATAPPAQGAPLPAVQLQGSDFVSVSALAFSPVSQTTPYLKDVRRQLLSLNGSLRILPGDGNLFIAPLNLPDHVQLTGLTVFGEDFDNQGAIQVRLKRCDHGQARCLNLAETTSTDAYAAGPFETTRIAVMNEVVDNSLYSYGLEVQLTALLSSGLRSVRLELSGSSSTTPGMVERWSLADNIQNFLIPNTGFAQVRICTDDLSHLNNPTHYPILVVDGRANTLGSSMCVTVWGRNIELRRELNTGPSSGTYQIIR